MSDYFQVQTADCLYFPPKDSYTHIFAMPWEKWHQTRDYDWTKMRIDLVSEATGTAVEMRYHTRKTASGGRAHRLPAGMWFHGGNDIWLVLMDQGETIS